MINVVRGALLVSFLLASPAIADTDRTIVTPIMCNNNTMIYVSVINPSNVSQRVQMRFKVHKLTPGFYPPSKYYMRKSSNHTAKDAVHEDGSRPGEFITGERMLPQGAGFQASIYVDGRMNYDGTDTCSVTITVTSDGDRGYVSANALTSNWGEASNLVINSGRPF